MARNRTHIFVRQSPQPDRYRPHPLVIDTPAPPSPTNPRGHAARLTKALEDAAVDGLQRRTASGITVAGAAPNLYVLFEGQRGFGLKLENLDAQSSGIELVSVTERDGVEHATVFVPDGKVKHFLKRFEQYATERTKTGERKHKDLVERIAAIRLATLRGEWPRSARQDPCVCAHPSSFFRSRIVRTA